MRRALMLSAAVSLAAIVTLAVVAAQSTGTIRGVITDSSGAVLPGVTVTISGAGTAERRAVTNEKGEFVFVGVAPGQYQVTAALAGFSTVNVVANVAVDRISNLAITLHVGSLAETITVTGEARSVDVQSSRRMSARRERTRFNTETYDRIYDNAWAEAARKPLSTFSIDVDT